MRFMQIVRQANVATAELQVAPQDAAHALAASVLLISKERQPLSGAADSVAARPRTPLEVAAIRVELTLLRCGAGLEASFAGRS